MVKITRARRRGSDKDETLRGDVTPPFFCFISNLLKSD
jgi:hypothetical protein